MYYVYVSGGEDKDSVFLYVQAGDGVADSYKALFPNDAERPATNYRYLDPFVFDVCDPKNGLVTENPSTRVMPAEYFMFFEEYTADKDLYVQSDGRPSVGTAISAAIGFR